MRKNDVDHKLGLHDKLKIGQVVRATGLHPNTIRKLEREGLIQAERTLAGYRIFDEGAISKIREFYQGRQAAR